MVPKKLFQLVLVAGGTGFGQFRISEESGMGTGPVLTRPLHGSLFLHPCLRNLQGQVKTGERGQGGDPLPAECVWGEVAAPP